MSYKDIERAIINELIDITELGLNTNSCSILIDDIIKELDKEQSRYGCLVTFGRGYRQTNETFAISSPTTNRGKTWSWEIMCAIIVRWKEDAYDMEDQLREIVDKLRTFLDDATKRRLGGAATYADVSSIESPEQVMYNDTPYYFIPFLITVVDKF